MGLLIDTETEEPVVCFSKKLNTNTVHTRNSLILIENTFYD